MDSLTRFNFYNDDLKKEFLKSLSPDSALTYGYILNKATSTEELFNQDLYDFNMEQISLIMKNTKPVNMASCKRYAGIIKSYVEWAFENGYSTSNIIKMSGMSEEWYKTFIMKDKLHISYDELKDIIDKLVYYQDKAVLMLAFYGIVGEDMIEMKNLKKSDIDFDNQVVTIINDEGKKELEINDNFFFEIIKGAINEEWYSADNKIKRDKNKKHLLNDNEYVLRTTSRKNNQDEPINKFVLYKRLRFIKEWFDYPLLSYKNLEKSCMIKMAVDLYLERGKLDSEELNEIGDRFNLTKIIVDNNEYHQMTKLKSFINRDNILELYGIDIDR